MLHAPIAIVMLTLFSITDSGPEPSPPPATVEIAWLPAEVSRWTPEIETAARVHGVDPDLVAILMLLESNGEPTATSPSGAKGLMQLMPKTAEKIASDRGLPVPTPADLEDPALNLDFAAYLLAELITDLTDGSLDAKSVGLVAAGYNAGIAHTIAWQAGDAKLSAETKQYRAKAMRLWRKRFRARA
jgi:soluble lytic murein transglycosylase-like protein